MKKIRTYLTYDHTQSRGEKRTPLLDEFGKETGEFLPSMTVPDMTYSPRDLLIRSSQGLPLTKSRNLLFTEDNYTPDLRTMDLVDIDDLREDNLEHQRSLARKMKARADHRRQRIADAKKAEAKEGSDKEPKGGGTQ